MLSLMLVAALALGAAGSDLKVADLRWADGDTVLVLGSERGSDSNRVYTLHVDDGGIAVKGQLSVPSSARAILANPSGALFALSDLEGGVSVFDGERQRPVDLSSIGAPEALWRSSTTFVSHLFPARSVLFVNNTQALGLRLPGQNFLSLKITYTYALLDLHTGVATTLESDAPMTPHYHHHGPAFGPGGKYFVISDAYAEPSSLSVYTFTPFERVHTFPGVGRPLDFLVGEDLSMKVLLRCAEKLAVQRVALTDQGVTLEDFSAPGHIPDSAAHVALNDTGVWRRDYNLDTLQLLSNDGAVIRSLPAMPDAKGMAVSPDGKRAVLWSASGDLQMVNTDPAGTAYTESLPEMATNFSSGQQGG